MGLPMETEGRVRYAPLDWATKLNESGKDGLLIVDEITTAPSTFKAFLRIVQERYVGEYKLNDNVSIVAIANPPEIAVDGVDLAAPVANRFLHLDWHFDMTNWLGGLIKGFGNEIVPDPSTYLSEGSSANLVEARTLIATFLKNRPDLVKRLPEDFVEQGRAWASPRSWTNLADVLAQLRADDQEARHLAAKGLVGEGAAIELLEWSRRNDLYSVEDALATPSAIPFKTFRADQTFALLNAVAAYVSLDGSLELWEKALKVMVHAAKKGKADVGLLPVQNLLNMAHALENTPADVLDAYSDILINAGLIAA